MSVAARGLASKPAERISTGTFGLFPYIVWGIAYEQPRLLEMQVSLTE